MLTDTSITYEQPLNEHIRVCLRLEHLFQKIKHHLNSHSSWDSRTTLTTVLEILNVIDRPDLKIKLTKALSRHAEILAQLEHVPSIDKQKLRAVLDELDQLTDSLHSTQGKLGQSLRGNDFLNTIRQQMGNPAGACNFSTPAYHLWVQHSPEDRIRDLKDWMKEFDQLRNTVELILQLTRENSTPRPVTATNGFYQESLNAQTDFQMIRVKLPTAVESYPEISVGRHRLSIHFFSLNTDGNSRQSTRDISFQLTCCKL